MTPPSEAGRTAAATLGVPRTATDPAQLSAHTAAEAVRRVHSLDSVAPDAALAARPDPSLPGAHYVDTLDDTHPRYWVGLAGEVLRTGTDTPRPGPNPEVARARNGYTAAVEAVRLRYRLPAAVEVFATPDAFVSGAFFVHEGAEEPVVRWTDPSGAVHDGYVLVDGTPRWDEGTVAARRDALRAQPATASLVD